jgi:hypothetical protein
MHEVSKRQDLPYYFFTTFARSTRNRQEDGMRIVKLS